MNSPLIYAAFGAPMAADLARICESNGSVEER